MVLTDVVIGSSRVQLESLLERKQDGSAASTRIVSRTRTRIRAPQAQDEEQDEESGEPAGESPGT